MKINCILFTVFIITAIAKGAWWVAAAQPIILSFGAAFAALNLDVQPEFDIDLKKLMIFRNDKEDNGDKGDQKAAEVSEASAVKEEAKEQKEELKLTIKDFENELYIRKKGFEEYLKREGKTKDDNLELKKEDFAVEGEWVTEWPEGAAIKDGKPVPRKMSNGRIIVNEKQFNELLEKIKKDQKDAEKKAADLPKNVIDLEAFKAKLVLESVRKISYDH